MNPELSSFAARLREEISNLQSSISNSRFAGLALELFALQFKHNSAYRKICEVRKLTPKTITHWTQIPAVPTSAFKELELTSLAPTERIAIFHSSGTTEQRPSRHFHSVESLALYDNSLISWFLENIPPSLRFAIDDLRLICLTPPPTLVQHSSLVYMFDVIRREYALPTSAFVGQLANDDSWALEFVAVYNQLKMATDSRQPIIVLGTAFSFVHLLDYLASKDLVFNLPEGSLVMETGGYKNRSRSMPKAELHAFITKHLGVPRENILCEYGMSELSSQAYDSGETNRAFHFPSWARAQIVSPEIGREVADGETGLIRIFDLANVFSVAAIQTEDLGIRRGSGFELIGRTQLAEPRGCSLMTA
jgi:hypothetical protein